MSKATCYVHTSCRSSIVTRKDAMPHASLTEHIIQLRQSLDHNRVLPQLADLLSLAACYKAYHTVHSFLLLLLCIVLLHLWLLPRLLLLRLQKLSLLEILLVLLPGLCLSSLSSSLL